MALYSKQLLNEFAVKREHTADMELKEAASAVKKSDSFDIFLSHSSLDARHVLSLKEHIRGMGFSVYVDWDDSDLDRRNVTPHTADLLRRRMNQCGSLFYAISYNAQFSKWMPWELGYFDGYKGKVAILPVFERHNNLDTYNGQEYLGLYPYVTINPTRSETELSLWIRWNENEYKRLNQWLEE